MASTSLMRLASDCARDRKVFFRVLVMEPGRWEAGTRGLIGVACKVAGLRALITPACFGPFASTLPLKFPPAVLSLPPRTVAPLPPWLVIFPALSLVSLLGPRCAMRAFGLLLPPPPPGVEANRPLASLT